MARYWIVFLFMATSGWARSEPLSFSRTLTLAVQTAPDVAGATANVAAARSSARAAGALPDPKLTFGLQNVPISGEDRWSLSRDFMTMQTVGLMQEVPNRGKRRAQEDEADATVSRVDAERRLRILTIRRDAGLAWLNQYYVERRRALLGELDRENGLFAASVQAQLAGGRAAPADSVIPKQEAAELADRRDDLSTEWSQANAALRRWVGSAADGPLDSELPPITIDPQALRGHVHEHPDLAVYGPMTQQAQAEVHEAEADKRPDWGVELNYGRRGPAFSDMVSLQVSISLPVFQQSRQDPRIESKRQELHRIEAEREGMLRDHTSELERELSEYEALTKQLTRARDIRIPLAREKAALQLTSYEAGKSDLTAVLSSRRELIEERTREITLESQRAQIVAKLYFVYGEGAQ